MANFSTTPTVTTSAVSVSGDNLVSGGNVTSDGGSPVTVRGICYGFNPYPDLGSNSFHTEDGTGTGSYTSIISLNPMTGTIYVRAYATNANGTAYGSQIMVNIDYLLLPTFSFNGHTYKVAPDPQVYNEYMIWNTANAYCENLTAYGYSDWRLPTIEELEMMYLNRTTIGGFVETTIIGNYTHYILYWSSSLNSSGTYHYLTRWWDGSRASNLRFENYGYDYDTYNPRYWRCHVRPIRIDN